MFVCPPKQVLADPEVDHEDDDKKQLLLPLYDKKQNSMNDPLVLAKMVGAGEGVAVTVAVVHPLLLLGMAVVGHDQCLVSVVVRHPWGY